jgi:hypothetical protein
MKPESALLFLLQGNFTFPAEMIVALIEFLTAVWLSLYMGWAVHSLRLIPQFTNTLLSTSFTTVFLWPKTHDRCTRYVTRHNTSCIALHAAGQLHLPR